MKITNLTLNTRISDFTILSKIILCNKSTHLEIYNLSLEYLYTIELPFYINRIIKYTEDILILVGKDRYEISVIEYNNEKGKYILVQIGYQEVSLSPFTQYHVWYNIVILYSLKSFKIYHYNRDKLVLDDQPNDFDFFTMCHLNFCGGMLNIIAKDIEDTTYLLRYNSKLALTKKIKKACSSIFSYNQGYIFISEGILWYEVNNKKVAESEFGNIRVKSSIIYKSDINHKSDLILSMENDELIRVNITDENIINVRVFKMDTYEDLHLAGDYILGLTKCGVCNLFKITNQKLEILNSLNSIGKLDKYLYSDNRIIFYNDKFQSIFSNFQICDLTPTYEKNYNVKKNRLELENYNVKKNRLELKNYNIKRRKIELENYNIKKSKIELESFYIFQDIFIGVYENYTEFKSINELDCSIQPIQYKTMGFYTYKDTLYFYSSKSIYSLTKEGINILEIPEETLLCSFYKENFVYYDVNGKLRTCNSSIDIPDISCILYHDDLIYVSTYNDLFIVFDNDLSEISKLSQTTFILGTVYRNCIYFYDVNSCFYFSYTQGKSFQGGDKYPDIIKIVGFDKLFLIGEYTVFYDDSLLLDIKYIKDIVQYQDNYYMLVDGQVYSARFIPSSYKYVHDTSSCFYMHKEGSKMFKVDNKGLLHYNKLSKKYDTLKNYTINNLIKAEYRNKEYTILSDTKIYRFNTKTKSLSQENTNKKLLDIHGRIKVSYNELFIDKDSVKYNRGLIRNVCIKKDKILIIDFFYGFHIYNIKNGWILEKEKKSISRKKYYNGYIWNDKIILSDDEFITVYDTKTEDITQFQIFERVCCFSEDTLEINTPILYCVTEGNSIWKIQIN